MIATWLGRFFRYCIKEAEIADADRGFDPEFSDYMTDREVQDTLNDRGHLVNWNEVKRRKQAGEIQVPWRSRNAAGAGA